MSKKRGEWRDLVVILYREIVNFLYLLRKLKKKWTKCHDGQSRTLLFFCLLKFKIFLSPLTSKKEVIKRNTNTKKSLKIKWMEPSRKKSIKATHHPSFTFAFIFLILFLIYCWKFFFLFFFVRVVCLKIKTFFLFFFGIFFKFFK